MRYQVLSFLVAVILNACGGSNSGPGAGSSSSDPSGTTSLQSSGGSNGTDTGGGNDGGHINGGPDGGNDHGFISTFKPALAIRATGCIMCHARVEANIITDFGFGGDGNGHNYYFGDGAPGLSAFSGSIYGDHADNWASASVVGSVFVPTTPPVFPGGTKTLAEYLAGVVTAPDATHPAPSVQPLSSVYIGAPTEARILSVAGPFAPGASWKFFSANGGGLDGLEMDVSGLFLRNASDRPFVCSGDLVVNTVLILDHLQLSTDNHGCRIYGTKSIFVQGAITYLGSAPYRHIQISSSRAVGMGVGFGPIEVWGGIVSNHSLEFRLQSMWTRPGFFTREAGTVGDKLDTIVAESKITPFLVDAASQPGGRVVPFERILVNAPNFQSRYMGEFSGVIVAELAVASLGNFAFKFDDVFSHVPILPLIRESDIISIRP